MSKADWQIRRGTGSDAEGIMRIWEVIAAERVYSAIDAPWNVEEQRRYLEGLSLREAVHVAELAADGLIIGFQSLDLWAASIRSMQHVGQLGTFLLPEWRSQGIGRALFESTLAFALEARYTKLVIQVRASNQLAQAFYRRLRFRECGRFSRQVFIDGAYDDEVMMEFFLGGERVSEG